MKTRHSFFVLIALAIAIGTILQLSSLRGATPVDLGVIFVFLWGMAPYLALIAAPRLTRGHAEVIAAVISTVVPDFVLRLGVASSTSSTAPIAYMFIPLWILVFFVPLGIYSVRVVLWSRKRHHG